MLLEIKLIFDPIALLVISPVCLIPTLSPAEALLPITEMFVPVAFSVIAPRSTIVVDTPPLPVTVRELAVIRPVAVTGMAVAVVVDCVLVMVTAPPLIAPVVSKPEPVVLLVTILMA